MKSKVLWAAVLCCGLVAWMSLPASALPGC